MKQTTESMQIIRRRVGQRVSRMTPDAARQLAAAISKRDSSQGATIEHQEIRDLTGGYASQNINFYVMRKLEMRAGIIKS